MMLPGLSRSTETMNANFTNVRIPRISKAIFEPFAEFAFPTRHEKEIFQAALRKP